MEITDLRVYKMPPDDPRYPAADAMKRGDGSVIPFSGVYIFEATLKGGEKLETPLFLDYAVADRNGDMSPAQVETMLKLFARAAGRMDEHKAA